MTKADVKTLCEADDKLCWWAMVLFAEMQELATVARNHDPRSIIGVLEAKAEEFGKLVIQRQLERAKEPGNSLTVEERLQLLEGHVASLRTAVIALGGGS